MKKEEIESIKHQAECAIFTMDNHIVPWLSDSDGSIHQAVVKMHEATNQNSLYVSYIEYAIACINNGYSISEIIAGIMQNQEQNLKYNIDIESIIELVSDVKNGNTTSQIIIEMESSLSAKELAYLTGLSESQCEHFMTINNLNGDEALEVIDIFMQSLNEEIEVPVEIIGCINNAGIYSEMANRLGAYNTMRGGVKGYGGFVFEEMHAADAAAKGTNIKVLGNNGIADFIVRDSSGHEILVQAKAGYKPHQIDWSKYEGQTIVVDKGNVTLANEAKSAGLTVQESSVFKKQADVVARVQQLESKLTGKTSAPLSGTAVSAHYAGLASAKLAARVGVSKKLGENIDDAISGNKKFEDAASDVIVDGAVIVAGAYVSTAALTVATSAATTAATAFAGTAAGVVITGAASSALATVGGTAAGGAVIAGATSAVGLATSAVATIAAAPLAPVVAGAAALGFVGKWIKDKW